MSSIEIKIVIPDSEMKNWTAYPDLTLIKYELTKDFRENMLKLGIMDFDMEVNVKNVIL